MMDALPIFLALIIFLALSMLLSLLYAHRLRTQANLDDPLWYAETRESKTTPLGYYSAQHNRRIARAIRKEPRG